MKKNAALTDETKATSSLPTDKKKKDLTASSMGSNENNSKVSSKLELTKSQPKVFTLLLLCLFVSFSLFNFITSASNLFQFCYQPALKENAALPDGAKATLSLPKDGQKNEMRSKAITSNPSKVL